jgi:hypothetical protein
MPADNNQLSQRFDSWPSNFHDRSAFPRNRQAHLTHDISQTQTSQQLLELLQQHAAGIDHINLSAAFMRARKRLCANGVPPEQQPAAAQQLLQHLHQLAEQLQQHCSARSLANIMSACGHLRMAHTVELLLPDFLQDSKLQQANPQEVSNTLWAVAILGMQLAEDQVQQLVQHLMRTAHRGKPRAVARTLAAVAMMGDTLPARQVADLLRLLQQQQQQLPQLQPQDIAETLWACGRMHYAPLQLLSALEQQPSSGLPQIYAIVAAAKLQELTMMAWACGQLGYSSNLLPGVVLQQAVLLQEDTSLPTTVKFTLQDLSSLCWSAAVLNQQQYAQQVLQLAAGCGKLWGTATDADLCQLYQVHLWLLDNKLSASLLSGGAPHKPGLVGAPGLLSMKQLQHCRHSWEQQVTARIASAKASDLQRSVFAALQALPSDTWQQPPVLEQRTADGALSIDIAATTRSGARLAIEVDGPSQLTQPACTHNGPTLFRNRALAARGCVVVSIPHWMWRNWRDATQQQQYLLSKLQAAEQAAAHGTGRAAS